MWSRRWSIRKFVYLCDGNYKTIKNNFMKNILSFFAIAALLFTACEKPETGNTDDPQGSEQIRLISSDVINVGSGAAMGLIQYEILEMVTGAEIKAEADVDWIINFDYKQQGKTLWDAMVDMYEEYGYYKEGLATMTLKGVDGAKEIQTMMTNFRENPPKELGGFKVLAVRDYKADVRVDLVSGEKSATGLPSSNVLYYELENNAWCCVRPSGTEPKIKFYFGVKGTSLEDAAEKLEKLKNAMVTA